VKVGIAIPTYNEVANIDNLIESIYKQLGNIKNLETTLLIIDDNSPDGTGEVVKKLAKKYKSKGFTVKLLSRKVKDGLGRAYIAGFKELLKEDVEYIQQMDADLSHNPRYLPAFIKAAKGNDLIVGSRYISGGETPDWTLSRRILSRGGNFYARSILGGKLSDYTGGFNMYSAKLMKKINPSSISSTGYGFLIELKFRASKNANTVHEIPIVFNDRQHGKSKLPKSTIFKNLVLVPRIKVNSFKKSDK
jgi:dolichol-phosphate mannosyltransferase